MRYLADARVYNTFHRSNDQPTISLYQLAFNTNFYKTKIIQEKPKRYYKNKTKQVTPPTSPIHKKISHPNIHNIQILKSKINKKILKNMSQQHKKLYQQKCNEFEELNLQFAEYQQQSNFIITDLEEEIKELKKKNQLLNRELTQFKEKRKNFNNSYEKEIELTKKEREQFKGKFLELEKKVIELENINQNLQSDLRATKATLYQYQQRTEKTMQELALLQVQMQQSTESNQEQIARLRSQLKQTEDELYAMHHLKNHKNDNSVNKQKQNQSDSSFHSKHSANMIADSKIKKRNVKFGQTLSQIRSYIKVITAKREQISKKYQEQL